MRRVTWHNTRVAALHRIFNAVEPQVPPFLSPLAWLESVNDTVVRVPGGSSFAITMRRDGKVAVIERWGTG